MVLSRFILPPAPPLLLGMGVLDRGYAKLLLLLLGGDIRDSFSLTVPNANA